MYKFSKTSLERLSTCDIRLQSLMNEVIKHLDITIVCGHRTEAEQNQAVKEKKSKLKFPYSKHNKLPSKAVDVAFYFNGKLRWEASQAYYVAGYIKAIADQLNINIRLGGDWNNNNCVLDESFIDVPHIELVD